MRGRRAVKPAYPMTHHQSITLKPHRKRSGFTQEELGFLLGLKEHSAISRFETGERNPALKTAFAYQLLFDRELPELFPALHRETRRAVGSRARQLTQEIKGRGETTKATYKLQRLARLEREGSQHVPAV